MINIGLTNWAKHPDLLENKKTVTLSEYSQFYNCVEIDSFFYGIKDASVVEKWVKSVPDSFKFVVKASKEITKQVDISDEVVVVECEKLKTALQPMKKANKISGILLQFPGFFDVKKRNIEYLRLIFKILSEYPLIVEFRNSSWYSEQYYLRTKLLLQEYKVNLAIVDEPQTIQKSIPLITEVTTNELAFFRFHGRNVNGWQDNTGFESGTRTNYRYSTEELKKLAQEILKVVNSVKNVIVIFNNNGGLDANKNAQEFMEILNLTPSGTSKQLKLF